MTENERRMMRWIADRLPDMVTLLRELVNIDSGSSDREGVERVGQHLKDFYSRYEIPFEIIRGTIDYGDALRAHVESNDRNSGQTVLLLGHRDTVFPRGEAKRRPFRIVGETAYGPGVADMKAGLVMHAFVLAAFKTLGTNSLPVVALTTADEEIGSPFSRAVIMEEARQARAVFNAEPSRSDDSVIVSRKGVAHLRVDVVGKASHAGAAHADGASAIGDLAAKVAPIHALTDYNRGVTLNVGVIAGGTTVNSVAAHAHCLIDLRYDYPEQRDGLIEAIRRIIERPAVLGTSAKLSIIVDFPPFIQMEAASWLLAHYQAAGNELGISVIGNRASGASDAAWASLCARPVLCSVGPAGGKGHSEDEFIVIPSMVTRAQLLALAISRLNAE